MKTHVSVFFLNPSPSSSSLSSSLSSRPRYLLWEVQLAEWSRGMGCTCTSKVLWGKFSIQLHWYFTQNQHWSGSGFMDKTRSPRYHSDQSCQIWCPALRRSYSSARQYPKGAFLFCKTNVHFRVHVSQSLGNLFGGKKGTRRQRQNLLWSSLVHSGLSQKTLECLARPVTNEATADEDKQNVMCLWITRTTNEIATSKSSLSVCLLWL